MSLASSTGLSSGINYDTIISQLLALRQRPITQLQSQPHKRRRAKTIGFRARMATPGGRRVIKRRRQKGRWKLTK